MDKEVFLECVREGVELIKMYIELGYMIRFIFYRDVDGIMVGVIFVKVVVREGGIF